MTTPLRFTVAVILVAVGALPLGAGEPAPNGDALPGGAIARFGVARPRWNAYTAAAFSPDGTLVTADDTLNAYHWDPATGRVLRHRRFPCADTAWPQLSADGKRLAARLWGATVVHVWDLESGQGVAELKMADAESLGSFVLSPDGTMVAVAGRTKSAQALWLARAANVKREVRIADRGNIQPPAFSPDGRRVATFVDSDLKCWDAATGKLLWTGEAAKAVDPTAFRFTPDGRHVLADRGAAGGAPPCWDAATGKLAAVAVPVACPRLPLFSADGRTLVASIGDNTLRVWDRKTGAVRRDVPNVDGVLALAPDGRSCYGWSANGTPQRWDLETGKPLWPEVRDIGHHGGVAQVAVSPDGRTLVSVGADGDARVWDVATRAARTTVRTTPDAEAVFTPDGRYLILGKDRQTVQWDLRTNQTVGRVPVPDAADDRYVFTSIEPSRDGKTVYLLTFCHGPKNEVAVVAGWDLATGKQTFRHAHEMPDTTAMLLPGGERLFASSGQVTDALTGAAVFAVKPPPDNPQHHWSWQNSAARAAAVVASLSASELDLDAAPAKAPEFAVRLWEADTGRMIQTVRLDRVGRFVLSPNGRWLAMVQPDGFTVREVATGLVVVTRAHGGVRSLAFGPDSRTLATGLANGTVLLWDLAPDGFKPTPKLSDADLTAAWADLAVAKAGYVPVWRLAAAPGDAVAFLRPRLKPVAPLSDERLRSLVLDLDAPKFATRESASKGLAAMGERAVPALRAAQRGTLSQEAARRIDRLLTGRDTAYSADTVRVLRAVDVLERIATPAARDVLTTLSAGDHHVPETRAAREALARLAR
jgi:WD40 repeat protein